MIVVKWKRPRFCVRSRGWTCHHALLGLPGDFRHRHDVEISSLAVDDNTANLIDEIIENSQKEAVISIGSSTIKGQDQCHYPFQSSVAAVNWMS